MGEKKSKFFIFACNKKRALIALFLAAVLLAAIGTTVCLTVRSRADAAQTARPDDRLTIVLDAGHGGADVGVTGKNGLKEADFNLEMVLLLRDLFSGSGFSVVLTRKDGNGLYSDTDDNMKRADMFARREIVRESHPDLVISIHANKYPSADRRGAQAFFDEFNPSGEALAISIQEEFNSLNEQRVGRTFAALSGDYFILKCARVPSVILECGFLSNPADEALLSDAAYKKELAEAIVAGTVRFLENRAQ